MTSMPRPCPSSSKTAAATVVGVALVNVCVTFRLVTILLRAERPLRLGRFPAAGGIGPLREEPCSSWLTSISGAAFSAETVQARKLEPGTCREATQIGYVEVS